jgi:hypothetical protein
LNKICKGAQNWKRGGRRKQLKRARSKICPKGRLLDERARRKQEPIFAPKAAEPEIPEVPEVPEIKVKTSCCSADTCELDESPC